jgi:H+/Cl- antiporter ClcA
MLNPLRGQLSSARWRVRISLWMAAIASGLIVVAFAKLADLALNAFFRLSTGRPWVPFLLTPIVGMIVVWVTGRYFSGSQGSGIPQVIAATRLAVQGKPVNHLVSMRIVAGKILLGSTALLGGFSAGREGPSVQVAASIMHFAHRFLPHARAIRASDLILAGGAAGIAAAFNTPLAGIVFAVEELGRKLETRTSGVLLSTIIIAGLVATALLGNYNYFGHFKVDNVGSGIILPVIGCGIACGVIGGAFSWLLQWPQKNSDFALWRWRTANPVLFAGVCGLAVACIGWASGGTSYGSGYAITSQVVSGEVTLPWHALFSRLFATTVTYLSGIPGGIFAPSLAVGAALGSTSAGLFAGHAEAMPIVALCMAGFLAAVTQSPITSAIIVMEMIDGHGMVISLMAIALLAKAVSSRMVPELYQQLATGFAYSAMQHHKPARLPVPAHPPSAT